VTAPRRTELRHRMLAEGERLLTEWNATYGEVQP